MSKQSKEKSSEFVYTTNQLARACGISRATVLRLEERGLIKPRARNKAGASRMYDSHDVYQTSCLIALQYHGFDFDEIKKFQASNYDYSVLKEVVSYKIRELQATLETLNAFADTDHHLTAGTTSGPGLTVYAEPVALTSDWSRNLRLFIPVIDRAVHNKYQLNCHFPPAIYLPGDYVPGQEQSEDIPCIVSVPLEPASLRPSDLKQAILLDELDTLPETPGIIRSTPGDYSYVSWRGSMEGFSEAFEILNRHIDETGKEKDGFALVCQFAGEFYGKRIPAESNFIRILQPVRPDTDDKKEGRPE